MVEGTARAFAPVVGPGTRVLILGSLPGAASIAAGEYYAHPRNLFWTLMGGVIGRELTTLPYAERLAALGRARVGLWDVLAGARRVGSLDAAIRAPERRDLIALAAGLPALRAVGANGRYAAAAAARAFAGSGVVVIPLPSSSPAYAAMPFAAKQAAWNALASHLGDDGTPRHPRG